MCGQRCIRYSEKLPRKKNPLSMGNRPKAYPLVWSMKNLFATPPFLDETPSLYTHVHDKAEKTL